MNNDATSDCCLDYQVFLLNNRDRLKRQCLLGWACDEISFRVCHGSLLHIHFRYFAFPQDRPLTIDALLERFLTGTEKEKTWNIKYRERDGVKTRVVMWDMTGIEAYRF